MSVPNLPKLQDDARAVVPPRAGEWMSVNVRLPELAESLDLPDTAAKRDLKSVPDVWAQVLAFQNALIEDGHPMHAVAVAEWRGLLTTFALARVYDRAYRLDLRPVPLVGTGRAGAVFRRVLTALPPTGGVFDARGGAKSHASWLEPALIYVRDLSGGETRVAGVLNPATLVAPGKGARGLKLREAPWAVAGFDDPAKLEAGDALPAREYAILAAFLETLEADLGERARESGTNRVYNTLTRQLREFRNAAMALAGGYERRRLQSGRTPVGGPGGLQPLYEPLLSTFAPGGVTDPDAQADLSDCRVALRDDCIVGDAPVFKGLILLDEALARTLGRRAQDVHVWGHYTLRAVLDQRELQETVRTQAAQAGWLLVKPDDFFTSEFAKLGDRDRIEGHGAYGAFADAVLPLSPLALLALAPDQILKQIDLQDQGDGGRTVSLKLSVTGAATPHAVSRTYRTDAGPGGYNVSERTLWLTGGIAAWPDFHHQAWRWNFLRLVSEVRGTKLRARFGLSAHLLAQMISTEPTVEARAEKARAWFDPERLRVEDEDFRPRVTPELRPAPAFQRLRYVQDDEAMEELQVSASPFEAVCLSRSRTPTEPPRPVGMVLLAGRKDVNLGGRPPVVAVDFGTTNTVACVEGAAEALVFRNRVKIAITDPKTAESDRFFSKWNFVDFLPPFEHATPIPTVSKRREVTSGRDAGLIRVEKSEDDRALFSDLIYFQPPPDPTANQTRTDIDEFSRNKDRLTFNLKWGLSQDTQEVARRFLRQFMLMTSAELLADGKDPREAVWRFSYPEAMNETDRQVLESGIRRSWSSIFVDVADGVKAPPKHPVREMTTEGAAAAKYFSEYQRGGLSAGRVLIVLDIGGGTTDIAVLRDQVPLWRDSFRLAGGDFITHYIMNHPRFFERIKLPDFAELLRKSFPDKTNSLYPGSDNDGRLKAFGELLFSNPKFSAAMKDNYMESMVEPEGRGLKHSAWAYLGGVLFYMGMVARQLVEQNRLQEAELERVTFGLGGRGATFFKDFGGDGSSGPLLNLLGCFRQGAGLDAARRYTPTWLPSPQAKLEVVLGMVGDSERDRALLAQLSAKPPLTLVPLGETLQVAGSGRVLAPEDDVADLPGGEEFADPELDGLKRYLAALSKEAGMRIDLKSDRHDGAETFIRNKVLSTLREQTADRARAMAADPDGPRPPKVEPPFIAALRALLDRLGRPLEERTAYIAVREL